MQDEKLTLDKAINEAKSSELIKQHFEILKGDSEDEKIDRIQNEGKPIEREQQNPRQENQCYRCGKSPTYKREDWPTINATCLKCRKQGHYAMVCKSKKVWNFAKKLRANPKIIFLGQSKAKKVKPNGPLIYRWERPRYDSRLTLV